MICVYPADCTDFSTNGSGTLAPLTAEVTETLNGEYELTLVHSIDEAGKWQRLVEGCIPRVFEDARMFGLGDPEIKDFGTSFRVSLHRKPFETDPFGVVIPSKEAEHEVQHQSSASNDAEHDAKETSSASPDAQKQAIDALLASLPEKNQARAGRILDCMIHNPHSTAVQIGKEIGLSKATVQRAIDGMKAVGIVTLQGSNNGGQWVIRWK